LLQIARGDRANRALRLRQNQIRLKLPKNIDINAIDRKTLRHDFLHAVVDLIRSSMNRNLRRAADGQLFRAWRKITFVRTADEMIGETQCGHGLGSTW